MAIFIHHVGKRASERNFPKTVIWPTGQVPQLSIFDIERFLTEFSADELDQFNNQIRRAGADSFQAWGIPVGSEAELAFLKAGDYMLLISSMDANSSIEYFGRVVARSPRVSFELSQGLWKSDDFPVAILMEGRRIVFPWVRFVREFDLQFGWIMAGRACRIPDELVAKSRYKTQENFVNALRQTAPPALFDAIPERRDAAMEPPPALAGVRRADKPRSS